LSDPSARGNSSGSVSVDSHAHRVAFVMLVL